MAKLVIVESPAKAKTIGKYLGKDYEVTASMGHIRDLPKSQLGIDVEHDYAPQYINIKDKSKLIKELKAKAKQADGVLLATDPDREGEAISWHLANILGLDPHEPNRVTFDEITKKGVQEGMAHPRTIDMDLFNAQQARRALDRLVGYKLSPFLWHKVRRGLSAGRVQSVAVRIIRDREIEIENFKPEEYWNIDANLKPRQSGCAFNARLTAQADGTKLVVKNKKQADAILAALDGKPYTVGALVLSNHALFDDLIVAGTPIHTLLNNSIPPHEDKGSIITVLATDIPLSERQLRRLCRRALVGLSRTGSYCGNGSGEIVIAFTTANRVPHYSEKALLPMTLLHDDAINPLFRAVAECVEESVLSSLLHAETVTGNHGQTFHSLTELLKNRA